MTDRRLNKLDQHIKVITCNDGVHSKEEFYPVNILEDDSSKEVARISINFHNAIEERIVQYDDLFTINAPKFYYGRRN